MGKLAERADGPFTITKAFKQPGEEPLIFNVEHDTTGKVMERIHVQRLIPFRGKKPALDDGEARPPTDKAEVTIYTPQGVLREGNMVIFANRATKDIYIANIMWVEQATDIMAIHYYMHEPRTGEPYSNKTKLSDRKNLAPEYFRKVHGKEMSVSTFSPKPSDEACAQDVKYKQFDILAAGFEMEEGTKRGKMNIPEQVVRECETLLQELPVAAAMNRSKRTHLSTSSSPADHQGAKRVKWTTPLLVDHQSDSRKMAPGGQPDKRDWEAAMDGEGQDNFVPPTKKRSINSGLLDDAKIMANVASFRESQYFQSRNESLSDAMSAYEEALDQEIAFQHHYNRDLAAVGTLDGQRMYNDNAWQQHDTWETEESSNAEFW